MHCIYFTSKHLKPGGLIKLVIYQTLNRAVVATIEAKFHTVESYVEFLAKFDIQIDYKDALSDITKEEEVTLTLNSSNDYRMDA